MVLDGGRADQLTSDGKSDSSSGSFAEDGLNSASRCWLFKTICLEIWQIGRAIDEF